MINIQTNCSSYNVRGEPKCWYGVPGTEANAFEQVYFGTVVVGSFCLPFYCLVFPSNVPLYLRDDGNGSASSFVSL